MWVVLLPLTAVLLLISAAIGLFAVLPLKWAAGTAVICFLLASGVLAWVGHREIN